MNSLWCETIQNSKELTQGDILSDCVVCIPQMEWYNRHKGEDEQTSPVIHTREHTVIILSQSCDLAHKKIDSVVVCPIYSLQYFIENNQRFQENVKFLLALAKGNSPSYHLIGDNNDSFSVVDFHRIYALPKPYLEDLAGKSSARKRLLTPYKEHLSQAFARYFMRVGLPIDIDDSTLTTCYEDIKTKINEKNKTT